MNLALKIQKIWIVNIHIMIIKQLKTYVYTVKINIYIYVFPKRPPPPLQTRNQPCSRTFKNIKRLPPLKVIQVLSLPFLWWCWEMKILPSHIPNWWLFDTLNVIRFRCMLLTTWEFLGLSLPHLKGEDARIESGRDPFCSKCRDSYIESGPWGTVCFGTSNNTTSVLFFPP